MRFNENVKFGSIFPAGDLPDQKELRHIPQFYRASADYAYRLGGPVVRKFIDALPLDKRFKYLSIDSRVHMLMPGWMPCIGGWHCDDFYRPTNEQPDLQGIVRDEKYSKHHALVIGNVAPTEFISTPFNLEIPKVENGKNLYAAFDKWIESELKSQPYAECKYCGNDAGFLFKPCAGAGDGLHAIHGTYTMKTAFIQSGQTVSFDCFDFHRGTVSKGSGWRLFMRATESNHWEPQNEIRTQTQVYLENFHAGW